MAEPVGPPKGCAWIAAVGVILLAVYVGLTALGYIDAAKMVAPQ